MSDPVANQFTPRERFLVCYFSDPAWSKGRTWSGYDLSFLVGSVLMLLKFYADSHDEPVFAYVACTLLLGRLFYLTTEGARFTEDYRNIVLKYEARIAELTQRLKAAEPAKE